MRKAYYQNNELGLRIILSDATSQQKLESCLDYDYVIGMMFYGNSQTEHPHEWINKFKDREYNILSVILYASKDECFSRCRADPCPQHIPGNREEIQCNKYWDDFNGRENPKPFHKVARVQEKIIETEGKPYQQMGEEILRYLGSSL